MNKSSQINFRRVLLSLMLIFAMALAYLAGTISVEAKWFQQDGDRANTNQISAISAAITLLLLDDESPDIIFLPLIMR